MNYKEQLIELYNKANTEKSYLSNLSDSTQKNIKKIAEKCFTQKVVILHQIEPLKVQAI